MNVFDFAMQMEDNGYEYYTGLARAATLPGLKTIFTDPPTKPYKDSKFIVPRWIKR